MAPAFEILAATVSERDFQDAVIRHAQLRGWLTAHFRPARVMVRGQETWRTPLQGDAKGFPDLVAVRRDRQVVAELKRVGKKAEPEQVRWLEAFEAVGAECYVWTPSDSDAIAEVLR